MFWQVVILIVSLVVLAVSANYLVNASIKIARKWGFRDVYWFNYRSYGTSAPELAVSAFAALKGKEIYRLEM